jgi:hypothetical protein
LKRAIGLPSATALVAGTIIGSSIFVQASEIALLVPRPEAILLAWAVAGVLTLIGALVCAELTSAFPKTGGVYVFEPFQMAMDAPNVYVETAWCLQSRIVEFTKELPKHKVLYGSDTPPNEPGMWLRLLEVLTHEPPQGLNLDEDTLEDYLGNNLARMCGIEPTARPKTVEEAKQRLADAKAGAAIGAARDKAKVAA